MTGGRRPQWEDGSLEAAGWTGPGRDPVDDGAAETRGEELLGGAPMWEEAEAGQDPLYSPSPTDEPGPTEEDEPTSTDEPVAEPIVVLPVPPLVSARGLLGAAFELLVGATGRMRAASFYAGLVLFVTLGPVAFGLFGAVLTDQLPLDGEFEELFMGQTGAWLGLLTIVAGIGLLVVSIESSAMAIALLGAAYAGRPLAIREAIQRARMSFWRLVIASVIVTIPTSTVQELVNAAFGAGSETSFGVGLLTGLLIQMPFVYASCGIVLGDVDPFVALRRSIVLFRARKRAGVLLAVLPTAFSFILLFGLAAGFDVVLRVVDLLGLGEGAATDLATFLTTLIIGAGVFALGTLVFTVSAVIAAPQVVMFVGLTHTTVGLDRVVEGGSHSIAAPAKPGNRFRLFTRPMSLAIVVAVIGLVLVLAGAT